MGALGPHDWCFYEYKIGKLSGVSRSASIVRSWPMVTMRRMPGQNRFLLFTVNSFLRVVFPSTSANRFGYSV